MDAKTGLYIGVAFAGGLLLGGLAGYAISKKNCDTHTQQAIDEMKEAHKKEIESLKKGADNVENAEDEKSEESKDPIKKPPIMEMASIINSDSDSYDKRTKYSTEVNREQVKEKLRDIVEEKKEEKEKSQTVINYDTYVQLTNSGYFEKNFNYDVDEESWRDWNTDSLYDTDELPFDASEVVWGEDDICYICDKDNHSIYVLEKVF